MPRNVVRGFRPDRLRELRKEAGLTPDDLAALVEVSRQSISLWETGRAVPQPSALKALAARLHTNIAALVEIPAAEMLLSDLRVLAGLGQEEVADLIGVSATTLAELERGVRGLHEARVAALARTYGIDPSVVVVAAAERSAKARLNKAGG